MADDLYRLLGVRKNARAVTINKAYRSKAKSAHPDQGGSQEDFQALKAARDVLLDPARRKRYDETGSFEAPQPDTSATRVHHLLTTLLGGILDDDADLLKNDLIHDVMIAGIQKMAEKPRAALTKMERSRARVTRLKGRFTRKSDGDNVLDSIVSWHDRQRAEAIAKITDDLAVFDKAVEMLRDYQFHPEEAERTFAPVFGVSNSFNSWGTAYR